MKKFVSIVGIGILGMVAMASAQVSLTTNVIDSDTYQGHLGYLNDQVTFESQVCHQNPGVYTGEVLHDFAEFTLNGYDLTISDDFSVSDLVLTNIDNTGNIITNWNGSVLTLSNVEIPACTNGDGVIQFYAKLGNIYPAGVTVGTKSSVTSGGVEIVSDLLETLTTVPEFDFNISIQPADRKVVLGAPVKVTFDLTTNTYRAISISDNLFDNNSHVDFSNLTCTEDIQQILPAQDAWQLQPHQTLTCEYDGVVNKNNFGIINLNHWLLKDLEDPRVGVVLASMSEQLEGIANIDVVGELVSGDPHAYGDLVQYRLTLTNNGSATANGYRVYMDFPVDYLENVIVTLPGGLPLLLNQEAGTNNYYVEAGLDNITIGGSSEITVSANLKNGVDHHNFTYTGWLENLPQYAQNNNAAQDEIIISAEYLEINFVGYMTPAVQYAISGTEISFDIVLANNGDLGCTGSIDYLLPNGQIDFVSASDSHFTTDIHYKTDIWVPAHTTDTNVTINAQVIDDVWADDSLFITLNGNYDCGAGLETYTDQIEIEPIAYINVDKTLTSVIPSSVGDVVEYTVVIENNGSEAAEIYRLYDLYPGANLHLQSTNLGQPNQAGVEYYRDHNMANLVIPAGGQLELVMQGILLDDTLGSFFDNTARVEMMDSVRFASVLSDTETVTVEHRNVDVSLTADEDPLYAISGTDLNFDIVLENNGSTVCSGTMSYSYSLANSVAVGNNPLQENMLTDFALNSGNNVAFNDIDGQVIIPSWADDSFYIVVTTNYTCAGVGPETVVTQLEIQAVADLSVTKELVSGNPRFDNDLVQYRIVVENLGSTMADGYALYDAFPMTLTYRDARFNGVSHLPSLVSNPGPLPSPAWYMWSGTYMNLAPGASMEIMLEGNLKAGYCYGELIDNDTWIELDPQYSVLNDFAGVTGVVASPDMFIDVQAVGPDPENLDDPIVFEISYTNSGNMTATNVVINGLADLEMYDFVSNVGMSPQPVETVNGREIVWPFDLAGNDIEVGESGVITLTGYLNSDTYIPTTPLCLSVDISVGGGENLCGNPNNNHAETCHYVTGEIADLIIEKSVVNTVLDMVEVGGVITYRLDVINTGNDSAMDVSFVDYLPYGLIYSGYNLPAGSTATCSYSVVNREFACDNIDLGAMGSVNDSTYVLLEMTLEALPPEGISLTNTGVVTYPGREFNIDNNINTLTIFVPGLADISVTKTVSPNIVAVMGDLVEYDITYTNIGARTGYDIRIYDNILFDGIDYYSASPTVMYRDDATNSGYRGGGNLGPGQSRNIHVVGILNDYYEAGTLLPNRAEAVMSGTEQTLNNNVAYVTGVITSVQDLSVNIVGTNLTHPNNDDPVWAVSGDIIQFEITYFNSGNTTIDNALLVFDVEHILGYPVDGLESVAPFTLGTLSYGSGGTIILTGIVGPQGYQYVWGVADIYESSAATEPADTARDEIVEPLECGDGFLTWNEQCDIGTGFGVIGDILPGQVCSIIQDNPSLGCALVTEYIPNTGCVDYSYDIDGITYDGQTCSYVDPIWIDQAACDEVVYDVVQVDTDEFDYDFVCYGENTNENTYISMDCGNGEVYEGYGSELNGTCHYTGNIGESVTYAGQCMVGNDIDNPDCAMPVDFDVADLSCELDVEYSVFMLRYDDHDNLYERDIDVTCGTESGDPAEKLTIDCGNGDTYESLDDDSFTETCRYEVDEDGVDDFLPHDYEVRCIIDDDDRNACEENIMADVSDFPICGNGHLEGPYEECDLTDDGEIIGRWLDDDETRRADSDDRGKECDRCRIEGVDNIAYQPPACFNTNVNLSVQKGEILPFRWNIDRIGDDFVDEERDCEEGDNDGYVIEDTLTCKFAIYDWNDNLQKNNDAVYEFERDCFEKEWSTEMDDYINELMIGTHQSDAAGTYYLEEFGLDGSEGFELGDEIDTFGEYKLVLEAVEYDVCNVDDTVVYPRVCEVNFAVTAPYLMQINAFGATKFYEGGSDISLNDFYAYNAEPGQSILSKTDIEDILEVNASDYDGGSDFKDLVVDFVEQQERLAILVSDDVDLGESRIEVKKVNGQQIYVMKGHGETITIKEIGTFKDSFTIITRGLNVIIEGSLSEDVNGMFLITEEDGEGGQITFDYGDSIDCNEAQVVNGIFYAEAGFGLTPDAITINDDANESRCTNGTLHVKGILIGDDIEDLVKRRRSHLNDWFYITGEGDDDENVRAQRREEIFAGAAVLIEYDPSLREGKLPPGADSFTKALDVYKR